MDADGSNQRNFIDHGIDPIWSFDDRKIAYASNHEGGIFHISLANSDGTDVHRITKHKGEDSNPAWAPDGASIAFASETEGDRRGLFIVAADGSEEHRLAFSRHEDFCFPSWSPAGKFIAFTALNRLGSQGIVVARRDHAAKCGEANTKSSPSTAKVRFTSSPIPGSLACERSYGQVLSDR